MRVRFKEDSDNKIRTLVVKAVEVKIETDDDKNEFIRIYLAKENNEFLLEGYYEAPFSSIILDWDNVTSKLEKEGHYDFVPDGILFKYIEDPEESYEEDDEYEEDDIDGSGVGGY